MIEITVNIPGLESLVEALKGMASPHVLQDIKIGSAAQPIQQPLQAPPANQDPPTVYAPAPQQMASPVTVPVDQPIQQPVQQPIQTPPAGIPTSDVNYTNEQLAVAMTSLVDAGKMDAVRALLNRFNAPSLMQLPKEMYGAFANELRQMGAKL
ncbi:MAG: hypothetical protein ABGU93_06775 [Acetobacterium sp.]|uniref:hypothetical protein n=1 Tax=Acetobacterium sp. TaxID=1872094 RepID=UPI003242CD80